MDEVDGTSAGDRGGIGALNGFIRKTKIPIICIANDKSLQKMKPLLATTLQMPFKRPDANMIRSRLMSIAFRYADCTYRFSGMTLKSDSAYAT